MRCTLALLGLALSGCAFAIDDVRVQVEPDLTASVSALASKSDAGADRTFLNEWRGRIEGCGGSTRAPTTGGHSRPEIEARFQINNDRERRIIMNCLAASDIPFRYNVSVARGWIYDTYRLRVRLLDKFDLGPDLIPQHFEVQMPGTIVGHTDNSRLVTDAASWTIGDGGSAIVEIESLGEDVLRDLLARTERLPPAARSASLDRLWEFEIRSQERKVSVVEMVGILGIIGVIIPLAGVVARLFRRRKSQTPQ